MTNKSLLVVILVIIVFFADFGLFSIADAAVVAIIFSILFQRFSVYILLLIGSMQDVPGLAGAWWYVGFVGVGAIVVAHSIAVYGNRWPWRLMSGAHLLTGASVLVIYGMLISVLSESLWGFVQSPDRPFVVVGFLSLFNIVCALHSFRILKFDSSSVFLRITLIVILVNIAFAAVMQVTVSPAFMSSSVSSSSFEGDNQLTLVTSLGFARVTSTYATPNGFALMSSLLMLLWLSSFRGKHVPMGFVAAFCVVIIGVSLLALSKAMLIFSCVCSAIALTYLGAKRWVYRLLSTCLLAMAAMMMSDIVLNRALLDSFRFDAIDFSSDTYRNIAWRSMANDFTWTHWFFGTGLSYWQTYFSGAVGFRLSDPHSWVFSYAGTYGLPGVSFFCYVVWRLGSSYSKQALSGRVLVLCLLSLLVIKDAVSIPYLLGNTPLTWLIWVLLLYAFDFNSRLAASGASKILGSKLPATNREGSHSAWKV